MKVLISEDDSVSALVLRKALEKLGYEPTVATDGELAWQTLQSSINRAGGGSPYKIIISDWMMPRLDGLGLCRRVREHKDDLGYQYFILLTAKGTADDKRDGLEAGADDFLVKPLDTGELFARLEVAKRMLSLLEDVSNRSSQLRQIQSQMKRASAPLDELLLQQGLITPDALRHALSQQLRTGQALSAILIANNLIDEEQIAQVYAAHNDMPYVEVRDAQFDPCVLALISRDQAERYLILPLGDQAGSLSGNLRVAVADPWNIEGIDLVSRLAKRRIEPVLAAESALRAAIDRAYRESTTDEYDQLLEGFEIDEAEQSGATPNDDAPEGDHAPVIKLLNTILSEALRRRASDIHIEPYEKEFDVRYRIDGELHVVRTLPRALIPALVSRIKVLADLDIAEKRLPQDGRVSTQIDKKRLDLRVSTLPVQFGERVVFRVLDRATASMRMEQLGFTENNLDIFKTMTKHPHGIVLVTGPTGSGKTTTLYATLNALKSPTTNIVTCEDPIEYQLDRIGQSAVNEKAGVTFGVQLRALMRQDPDVILIGEMRDQETAEIGFRAALTGHLVFSTLHCNEAAGAPTRLADMQVAPFLTSSALLGVIAQRLIRRLCPHCKKEYEPDADRIALIEGLTGRKWEGSTLFEPVGCQQCDNMGYRGRMGAHEVLLLDDHLRSMIMQGVDTATFRQVAINSGMLPLVCDGMTKAQQGLTSFEEVQRKLLSG